MAYVDGFLLAVPKKHLQAYRRISRRMGKVWREYGALDYRDRVNAKVMKDPRVTNMDPKSMPFDMKRMVYGGFRVLVDL